MKLGLDRRDARMGFNLFRMILRDRFLGSGLGMAWAIASPLLLLSIFTFVFGFVFKARLPGADTSITYVIWLISGYGPWLAISEGLSSATASVVASSNLIKNLPMKSELLPIAAAMTGLVPLCVAVLFQAALLIVNGATVSWTWALLPYVIVLQFVLVAGLGLFLASINVFIRDLGLALPNLLLIVLFASPIFYPLSAFPGFYQKLSLFNPFYVLTEAYRQPLLHSTLPPLWQLVYVTVIALLLFWAGLAFFRRLKTHFDSRL